ncbi:MAG: MFS transporter [Dysgonamonadaceae bacterium]|nr:MFS transporter [Dysgonamonadaceae bacterium]
MRKQKFGIAPFLLLTFIYFIVGFMTTVNGQCQGPLKVAFLADADNLRNTFTTLISFFFFLGYLLNSPLGGKWIDNLGFKTTVLRALWIMTVGVIMYALSSWMSINYSHLTLTILKDIIPYGFFVFLFGSFLMGTSAAILQVVVNPYISAYPLKGTQPVQRVNISFSFNSFATTIAPFFVTVVMFAGIPIELVTAGQVLVSFLVIAACVVLITLITSRLPLPNLEEIRSNPDKKLEKSIWSFRHFKLGVIAIFFYVGAEVAIGVNVNLHAMEIEKAGPFLSFFGNQNLIIGGLDLGMPALLATLYWGGLMVGRVISGTLKKISPRTQLVATTVVATILTSIAIIYNNLWVLVSVGLCHSVMWGCIFTISTKGLKEYTSKASGIFMMGVFGGAVFPVLQGAMSDIFGSWRWTWFIVIISELVMLHYALYGSHEAFEIKELTIEDKS